MRSMAFAAFNAARTALPPFDAVTVNRNKIMFRKLLLIPLLLLHGAVHVCRHHQRQDDGLTWPVKVDLLCA